MEQLTSKDITQAFERLNGVLAAQDRSAQVYLVGGAVMCLVHRARTSTRDVDDWFTGASAVRAAAKQVAGDMALPEDWLSGAAKAFIPRDAGFEGWRSLSHLDISVADTPTLLAMKCAATRTGQDADDIRFLSRALDLTSSQQVLEVVSSYYPPERLPVRSRLVLEEMLDDPMSAWLRPRQQDLASSRPSMPSLTASAGPATSTDGIWCGSQSPARAPWRASLRPW